MLIPIPHLNAGMNSQYDPRDLGPEGAVNIVNFDNGNPGYLKKRLGYGTESTYTGQTIPRWKKWVNDAISGGSGWVYYETTAKTIFNEDTPVKTLTSATDISILDFYDRLRFANGRDDDAGILQNISRKFFWSDEILYYPIMTQPIASVADPDFYTHMYLAPTDTVTGNYDVDYVVEIDTNGTPDTYRWSNDGGATWEASNVPIVLAPTSTELEDGVEIYWTGTTGHTIGDSYTFSKKGSWHYDQASPDVDLNYTVTLSEEDGGTMDLDTNTYYYKLVPVLDGNQLGQMPKAHDFDTGTLSGTSKMVKMIFNFSNVAYYWNPRVTAIWVYRATSWNGDYRLVKIVNTTENDDNLNLNTGMCHTRGLYASNKLWSINGFAGLQAQLGGNTYTIESNTEDVCLFDESVETGKGIWGGVWSIISPQVVPDAGSDFEVNSWADWTVSNFGAPAQSAVQAHSGTNSMVLSVGGNPATADLDVIGSLAPGTYRVSVWVYLDASYNGTVSLKLSKTSFASAQTKDSTSTKETWVQLTGSVVTTTGNLYIRIYSGGVNGNIYVDDMYGGLEWDSGSDDGYAGMDVTLAGDLVLKGGEDYYANYIALVSGPTNLNFYDADQMTISNNVEKAIKFTTDISNGYENTNSTGYLYLGESDYTWQGSDAWNGIALKVRLTLFDDNLLGTSYHPTGSQVVKVNYEHAIYLDGRMFVGNIKLDPDNEAESHPNWVAFSELLQPDVIPVSNIIQMRDTQGGEITGLAEVLGDVLVFMTYGIYRLRVPSSNPLSWERIEAEEGIGCIAPKSVVNTLGNVVFAGKEHMYIIGPNFTAVPITQTIQDSYKAKTSSQTQCIYDTLNELLVCHFGTDSDTYVFDIRRFLTNGEESWVRYELAAYPSLRYSIDEDGDLYGIYLTGGSTILYPFYSATSVEEFGCTRTSGLINVGSARKATRLRYINMAYLSTVDDITVTLYADGSTTALWTGTFEANTNGTQFKSLRIGKRVRGHVQVKITTPSSVNTLKIFGMELEVE